MNTRENGPDFHEIANMFRVGSVVLLLLHFYFYCYGAFKHWKLRTTISDHIMLEIAKTGLYDHFYTSKLVALGLLALALLVSGGRKEEQSRYRPLLLLLAFGLLCYFGSYIIYPEAEASPRPSCIYMGVTFAGYLLMMAGAGKLYGALSAGLSRQGGTVMNEGFQQEERLLKTPYSLHLRGKYRWKGRERKSWINFINPRRGILIVGSPGAGKSWFIIEPMIRQLIEKGFVLFVYDFKAPVLTRQVYNLFLQHKDRYPSGTAFYSINFTDLSRSHRCNLIDPSTLKSLADAIGCSKTILLSMNKTWVNRQGEFFVESPVNFLAAVIWWLRKYKNGAFCTLPHVIELAQMPYDKLFTILGADPEIQTLVSSFIQAFKNKSMELVDSQISSAKIPLGRLASADLYYILSGNDLSLDINNPSAPKILCLGGDPPRQEALAPVLSLYIDRLNKLINRQGQHPCAVVCDEFATVRAASVLTTVATGRSNDIITILAVQDHSQLQTQYSPAEADMILNTTGNLVCGQVGGKTAEWVCKRFPAVAQHHESVSENSRDTSISRSQQMANPMSTATIATLSAGEFAGIVTDEPKKTLKWKAFHARLINDPAALEKERKTWKKLPVVRKVDDTVIRKNFLRIKDEVRDIMDAEMARIAADVKLRGFMLRGGG